MTMRLVGFVASICVVVASACASRDEPTPVPSIDTVVLPDFSRMEEPVQRQMREAHASLTAAVHHSATDRVELGRQYGEMGKLLMAATYLEPAEACYLNAQMLAPADREWPYYLGHIYRVKGPLEKSVASFERALQLQPDDLATLIWLGDAYLAQGREEAAEPVFQKALALEPRSAAARSGMGRAALEKKDYARAVKELDEALALEPRATGLHYLLAMAYRGAGDLNRAEAHLKQRGDIEPRPPDPLMWELDDLLESVEAYGTRGGRALAAGDAAAAAEYFRKGLQLAPANLFLQDRLGTALLRMGETRAAGEQFERVLQASPDYAKAHFGLGLVMEASGRHKEAIDRFRTAVKYEPGYIEPRLRLAAALSRNGRPQEGLIEYEQALEIDPAVADAAFGAAMTLVRLHRYQEARDRLADGMDRFADRPRFGHALARLLAAAPDPQARDGARAKALVGELLKTQPSIELGETMAMTLAELGQYDQAAAVQRDMLAAAEQAGRPAVVQRLTENLKLYEAGKPCRRPFTETEMP